MANFDLFPVNMAPIIAIPLIVILWFSFSKSTGEILYHIPKQNIIRLQSFRFFVELLLWALFVSHLMPIQMSFEGRNFDVLSGITAPVVAYLAYRNAISRPILILWNILCLGLLINIVTIAILSMPTSFQYFINEPSNTIVTQFPISWLPGFLVPLAYGLHFLSLRKELALKG
ncbi:MAG: hypothetical protein L0Y35_06045 [Flammeovirgaceae bacterium]|nr:hypothetical protein [Flammeovirgaceae bacterium]